MEYGQDDSHFIIGNLQKNLALQNPLYKVSIEHLRIFLKEFCVLAYSVLMAENMKAWAYSAEIHNW